jgi:hypothetical protein
MVMAGLAAQSILICSSLHLPSNFNVNIHCRSPPPAFSLSPLMGSPSRADFTVSGTTAQFSHGIDLMTPL